MKNNGKTEKNNTFSKAVVFIAMVLSTSFFMGRLLGESLRAVLRETSPGERIAWLGMVWTLIFIWIFVQTIIHEAGHLIAGKLSGYKFVSFRVFSAMFVMENNRLVKKKFSIPGTAGQCLMVPPENSGDEFPFVLYNLGGCLMNFIASGICFIPIALFPSPIVSTIFTPGVLAGLLLGFTNIIPRRTNKIANDGYNTIALGKRRESLRSFGVLLRANAMLSQGRRYRDLPDEWVKDNPDLDDIMTISHAVLRYNYLFDGLDFDEAKKFAEYLLVNADGMLGVQKSGLYCDLLFFEIIGERRKDRLDSLYTKDVKTYLKATSFHMSSHRLLYAYAKLVSLDNSQIEKSRKKFEEVCATYPNVGEVLCEREIINFIDDLAEKIT